MKSRTARGFNLRAANQRIFGVNNSLLTPKIGLGTAPQPKTRMTRFFIHKNEIFSV